MLCRDSEDEIWSRFVFELVIWTQPSGPLCLWQCFTIQDVWQVLPLNFLHCFKDKLIFVRYMKQSLTLVFGTVFIGWNQLQIFNNDNFSIIPKSVFSDNDNLPISCKNADLLAVDNFFDNIAHPYLTQIWDWKLKHTIREVVCLWTIL